MITRDTVAHVARLARLRLDEDEATRLTAELGAILAHVEQLAALDTTGVEPTSHPLPLPNVLRADEPGACLTSAEVVANAPDAVGPMFRVPRILRDA